MLLTPWLSEFKLRNQIRQLSRRQKQRIQVAHAVEVLEQKTMLAAAMVDTAVVKTATLVDENGEVAALPDSVEAVNEWDVFFVEFYGSTPDGTGVGIEACGVPF